MDMSLKLAFNFVTTTTNARGGGGGREALAYMCNGHGDQKIRREHTLIFNIVLVLIWRQALLSRRPFYVGQRMWHIITPGEVLRIF